MEPLELLELLSAALTLLLIMDPIGNIPVFVGHLKDVEEGRRVWLVARESLIALVILMAFLFAGPAVLRLLHIGPPSFHLAGGVLLFLISLGMIFPGTTQMGTSYERRTEGEPFIVPLATPLLAGPSSMATIMIFVSNQPERLLQWAAALVAAWVATTVILMLSARLSRLLGPRALIACERLMGMILIVVAVQMLLDGVALFVKLRPG